MSNDMIDKEKLRLASMPRIPKATPQAQQPSATTGKPVPKVIPMAGGGAVGQRRQRVMKEKAAKEFKAWRASLIDIIKKGCRLEFNPDGSYRFLIAPRIVHLVWATTIQERIKDAALRAAKAGKPPDPDEIKRDAMETLRDEVDAAQEQFLKEGFVEDTVAQVTALEAVRQSQKTDEDEEAEAARRLQEMRQEMIKEKEGQEEQDGQDKAPERG